ncbi:MAG: ATP-dependent Clp protease ATP-binding subunit ClpX, partial [Romboutsia sp.]|nr:ATP-dependent Clp protease ATP-binding subunit ClpX [Romboutsia sp.]
MIGPTGSGKTYLMTTLAKILDVPLVITDATSLTEAGYVGEDVESILSKLIKNANMDINRAERGIVYIDEIDKISRRNIEGRSNSRDVSGEGVQQALLKIIEGSEVEVPIDTAKHMPNKKVTINTKNILFVCGGAFDGIEKIITQRFNKKSIGFANKEQKETFDDENIIINVTHDDVIKYGFIPEFMGRVPTITVLNKLRQDDLKLILTKPKDALIRQYKKLLQWDGVSLEFTDEAIEYIVNTAIEKNIGARGLRGIIDKS